MSVLEGIISAIKDIVRCIVVDNITIENRMLNASINTICTILLNVLISPLVIYYIWRWFQPNNMTLYTDVDFSKHRHLTWRISKNKLFHDKITTLLQSKFKLRKSYAYMYDSEKHTISGISNTYSDEYHAHTYLDIPEKFTPIYSKNNHVIGVNCVLEVLHLAYDDDDILFEFLNQFRDCKSTPIESNALYVFDDTLIGDDDEEAIKSIIYNCYTFDNYISTSIDNIRKSVAEFKRVNMPDAEYEISNNYNLGIMLYGEPGTGKTLLVKTICNELKRSARIFKLHKIQTPASLLNKLSKSIIRNEVIIFDEFDFDASLISRSEHKNSDYIKELIIRKTKLLTSGQNNDQITEELKIIKREIKLFENKLDLSAVITALDGMHEQRNRVIIACTNRIESIDSALLRPGRFDIVQELTAYNSNEIAMYLTKFYKTEVSGHFKSITPANLRQLCKCNTIDEALKKIN